MSALPATSIWRSFAFWSREPDGFAPEVWAPRLTRSLESAAGLMRSNLRCWYCRYPVPRDSIECPTCGGPGDHPAARPRLIVGAEPA